ncbi:MAG: cytochrome c maturation protein CcmE [Pseudomonadota bacterium]
MTRKKQARLILIVSILAVAGAAIALTLTALKGSITYFYTPSDIASLATLPSRSIRLGGLVEAGSVKRGESGDAVVTFTVTDGAGEIDVAFTGILPDLFREGQGVIVQGRINPDRRTMTADDVLAKHDENYMPKEVAESLKEKGYWQSDDAPDGE